MVKNRVHNEESAWADKTLTALTLQNLSFALHLGKIYQRNTLVLMVENGQKLCGRIPLIAK